MPIENAAKRLARACRRFGVRHETHLYPGVDHAFLWVGNDNYRPEMYRDAWERTLSFLRENGLRR